MKRTIKKIIFFIIYFFFTLFLSQKYRRYLLSTWHTESKRTKLENFIYKYYSLTWFYFEYDKEDNPVLKTAKQELLMGGESGVEWANIYNSRVFDPKDEGSIGNMPFTQVCPIFQKLDNKLSNSDDHTLVIQIGMSSGREIAWYAEKHTNVRFIGLDIYSEVVNNAEKMYNLSNLKFITLPADLLQSILKLESKASEVIIFASGSLQYVQPEHLKVMFDTISKLPLNISVYLTEPANKSYGLPNTLKKSVIRGNFSYTHDYQYYAEQAGFFIEESKIIEPFEPQEDFYPNHQGTVHYHLIASKN